MAMDQGARGPKRVVVLGATSGMGRALARRMAARGDRLHVLGIGDDELARSVADLEIRAGVRSGSIGWSRCDLEKPETFAGALEEAETKLGGLDVVVVTAAMFAAQADLESDAKLTQRLLTIDFTNTVLFCEEAKRRLLARGGGTLCVFSSVAGERGRKPVALYGAAKAGLTRYLEALDHKHHAEGLRVVTVKPGFVKTGMTAGLKPPPFAGEPEDVAARVVRAVDRGTPEVYAPVAWGPIMGVIRRLPRFVMRRVGF
ncbi:Decaprenylphosphoryl-2-keto-beta-D-erythro-pentose reductase [Sandaracinus amylolyticus]|nr:Decaprenylphosphoryl-2-keto-beta-D-erythro-pentose reductase [Sandaracinus amylolyticus]